MASSKHFLIDEALSDIIKNLKFGDVVLLPLKDGSTFYNGANLVSSVAKYHNVKNVSCEGFKGVSMTTDEIIKFCKVSISAVVE